MRIQSVLCLSVWLTATSTPTFAQNSALLFDGVNDYVTVPDSPVISVTNTITVEAWVYLNRYMDTIVPGTQMGVVEKYGGGPATNGGYVLRIEDTGKVSFFTLDNGSQYSVATGATSLGSNEWYHIAGVWDGAQIRIYVNGVLDGSLNTTRNPKDGPTPLIIGNRGFTLGTPFAGRIDEVRIWNVVRSQSAILADMNRELSGSESGLMAYWRFDEGIGTSATNSAAGGGVSDGTLVNGPIWVTSPVPANVPFVDGIAGMLGLGVGDVAWGDYDNDGDLDALLTGARDGTEFTRLYRNNGNGTFTNINPNLPGLAGAAKWGDYDNDSDLDLLLSGVDNSGTVFSRVYRNNGNGTFTDINANLTGVGPGSGAWGDYDNDGDLDILLTGYDTSFNPVSRVYRNHGNGAFSDINANLPGVGYGVGTWGDYDNDGDLDILLIGITSESTRISNVYRNNGNGTFTDINAGLPGVAFGSASWGDYDNDSDLDLLLTGQITNSRISRLYRNNGNGTFTDINANLTGVSDGGGVWGDYDNDGDLDILLTGTSNGASWICRLYRNNGNGTFTDINANLSSLAQASPAWGDYDNDGDLDIVVAGTFFAPFGSDYRSRVYRNNSVTSNTAPAAPSGLNVGVSNSAVVVGWTAAADAQTPSNGLTYNLRVGTTPGGSDIISPMANSGTGYRRLPGFGNAQHGTTTKLQLAPGQTYYCSVQAIDSAFAGSPFSSEVSFGVGLTLSPPGNPRNPVPGDIDGNSIVDETELRTVLANYWPYSPWPYLTNVAGLGGGNVTFALTNSIAGSFSVEYTTNLIDWLFLGPAIPRYLFTDTNAPAQPLRYYRLRWP